MIKKLKNYTILFSVVFILIAIGCDKIDKKNEKVNSKNNQHPIADKKNTPIIKYDHLTYSFQLYFDRTGHLLNKIEICSEEKIYQTIKVNKIVEVKKIIFIDWNFDGYKDISIINNQGSGGTNYFIWNYNPITKQFIYNRDLSNVMGLEIDSISKHIIFHYRAGWQEEYWDTLKYKKSKLVFIKGMHQQQWNDEKGNQWRKRTFKKLIDRKYITKIDSSIIQ